MKIFLTDSMGIHKKYKDFLYIPEKIFYWKVMIRNDEVNFVKGKTLHKLPKNVTEIDVIVSPSNYLLIYDLFKIKFYLKQKYNREVSLSFFYPEKYYIGNSLGRYFPDYQKIENIFLKFMKRGFLSFLNYSSLRKLGLKRIEQLLVLYNTYMFQENYQYQHLLFPEKGKYSIINVQNLQTEEFKLKEITLIPLAYTIANIYNLSIQDSINLIFKEYVQLNITDPFSDNIKIVTTKVSKENIKDSKVLNSIYELKKITNIQYQQVEFVNTKNNAEYKRKIKIIKDNKFLQFYLKGQENPFKIGKLIQIEDKYPILFLMENFLSNILSYRDICLNIYQMIKMKKIYENQKIKGFFYISNIYIKRLYISKNQEWIDLNIWQQIYENQDYYFGELVDPIYIKNISFKCPLCGNNQFVSSPRHFICSSKKCGWVFVRDNLKDFGIEKIRAEEMIEALHNKVIYIKDKEGKNIRLALNDSRLKNYSLFFQDFVKKNN